MTDAPEAPLSQEHVLLEDRVMEYARAGWTVSNRSGRAVRLEKGDTTVRLYLDSAGQVQVDGPALPVFYLTGRMRAWLVLLAIALMYIAAAWLLGFFR